MSRAIVKLSIAALLVGGAPLLGVWLGGHPIGPYLEFPPATARSEPPPFSWAVFTAILALLAAVVVPIGVRAARRRSEGAAGAPAPRALPGAFPGWGWIGVALVAVGWLLAWTRFPWFAAGQEHTFTPLWLGYIVTVNALCHRRAGTCLMVAAPRRFALLFPLSALFWWFFEYLNRFVGNWYYVGVEDYSPLAYVAFASISFSTVLPAVVSTRDWLATYPALDRPFRSLWVIPLARARTAAALILPATLASLVGLGIWPNGLFPFVWVSPLLVLLSLQLLAGEETAIHPLGRGDWRCVCQPALAALVSGLFWELWNSGSLAHWEYAIPYVDRFRLFEMPLLGYAGYLPFGLACVVAASLIPPRWRAR